MRKRNLITYLTTVAALVLTGCLRVGPDYMPPDVPAPERWSVADDVSANEESVDMESLSRWWENFNDPVLTQLIERAVRGNLDLRTAVSRVRQARTALGLSRTEYLPALDASSSATRSDSGETTGNGVESTYYRAGFDAGWEVDLFGGISRSVESAVAKLELSEADLGDALVTLVSEVAVTYADVRSLQVRLSIAGENLEVQQETFGITSARVEAGLTTELDVEQARSNLESTEAQIPVLRSQLVKACHGLDLLLGEPPGSLDDLLAEKMPVPSAPLTIAIGVPADTLRHRSDVRSAERALAAQTAQVGVATAELYPKLQLSGSIGLEAFDATDLFSGKALTWSLGPSINWRVFDRRQIRRNIEIQNELQEQVLIAYEAEILDALVEVEDVLVDLSEEQTRLSHLRNASAAARSAVDLSLNLYTAGLSNFQDVLDAQRLLLSFQDQVAQSEAQLTTNLIRLYKSLGGGWESLVAG